MTDEATTEAGGALPPAIDPSIQEAPPAEGGDLPADVAVGDIVRGRSVFGVRRVGQRFSIQFAADGPWASLEG
ncbi:hypothetical protein [Bradyrhizobium sp. SRS-191]|uniref:hypothetical protein n=1 Tax=Bradyrhizobium sp. SRS-191 TaxID=2962606 RepID=UPI00211DDF74|nr:hypothetical protein [Bradyrhizobium sp. SRS-191]